MLLVPILGLKVEIIIIVLPVLISLSSHSDGNNEIR